VVRSRLRRSLALAHRRRGILEFPRHHRLGASRRRPRTSLALRLARSRLEHVQTRLVAPTPRRPDVRFSLFPFLSQGFAYYTAFDVASFYAGARPLTSLARACVFASTQLPACVAVALTSRASANAFISTSDVDGCAIARGERIGERVATAMMRDGVTVGALGGALAVAGALSAAWLAKTTDEASILVRPFVATASDARFATQFGCFLGFSTAAHAWLTDGLTTTWPSISRPRFSRLKRGLIPCARNGCARAFYSCLAYVIIVFFARVVVKVQLAAPTTRGLVFATMACWSGAALCSASWAVAFLCASIVYTDRYEFLPQSLAQGPKVACEPLIAALNYFEIPFVQHLAYLDMCTVAESGGRRRRRLIYGDTPDAAWPFVISSALAPLVAISRSVNKAMDRTMLAALRESDADAARRISEKYVQMNAPKPKFRHESAATQKAWDAVRQSEALSPEVAGQELCVLLKSYAELANWGARAASALAVAAKTEDTRGNAELLNPNLDAIVRTLLTVLLACRTIIEQGSPPVRATMGFTSSDLAMTANANSIVAKRDKIINRVLYFLGITATNRNDANGAITPAFTPAVPEARRLCDTVEISLGALAIAYGAEIKAMLRRSERFGPPDFGTPNELFDALEAVTDDLVST